MKRLFFILALCSVLGYALFATAVWHLSDGFSMRKISSELPYSCSRDLKETTPPEVKHILNQEFYYLDKGSQCYVFESADGLFVLKFFRLSRYRVPSFLDKFPLPGFLASIHRKKKTEKEIKLDRLFESCRIAYDELKAESGLIYLHLNKTTHLRQEVTVYDRLQRPYDLDIDQYEFLIQRKADLVFPYLTQLIDKGKRQEVAAALNSIRSLFLFAFLKEIGNSDAVVPKNVGFYQGKAVFLDVGEFRMDPRQKTPEAISREMAKMMRSLNNWLVDKDEELSKYLIRLFCRV